MSVVLEEPIVWFVGQVRNEQLEIQGVSATREGAIAMCRDENYFITPLTLEHNFEDEHVYFNQSDVYWPHI